MITEFWIPIERIKAPDIEGRMELTEIVVVRLTGV